MDPALLTLLLFLALTFGLAAVYMLVRDLVFGTAPANQSAASRNQKLPLRRLPLARDVHPVTSFVGRFDQWFAQLLVQSGFDWTPITALLLLVLVGTFLGGLLFVWSEAPLQASFGMFAGMGLVLGYLLFARSRRLQRLQDQLPPALEMLSRAVHAGESIDQALELVGEKSPEPLAIEFRRCANQLRMGLSLPAVMRALVHRVQLLDMRIFTTTLTVHRQAGGNLVEMLERLAAVIRDRLSSRRQMNAGTAAARMSAMFLFTLGPLIFLYMFFGQRAYIDALLQTPLGQSLMMLALFLEMVGLIWIARMLRTE